MRSISLKELFRQMRLNEAARSPEERKKEYIFPMFFALFSVSTVRMLSVSYTHLTLPTILLV